MSNAGLCYNTYIPGIRIAVITRRTYYVSQRQLRNPMTLTMNPTQYATKQEVRREALQRRNAMSIEDRSVASFAICNRVMDHDLFLDARGIHVYLPIGSEVDIRPLIDVAWEMGKQVGLMRVMEDGGSVQYTITPGTTYRTSSFGILEPVYAELFDMNICDLVIAPLVAADEQCNRVGYGKGYYDQFMTQFPRPTIGVAFEVQLFTQIPADKGDVKVDAVVTESRTIGEKKELRNF
jgi:5-formyltetrahydrofolate cyclo-ligase